MNRGNSRSSIHPRRTGPLFDRKLANQNRVAGKELAFLCRSNVKHARRAWGALTQHVLQSLRELSDRHALSVAAGDLQLLDGRWYVTHSGLVRIAQRRRCCGIKSVLQERLSDAAANRWIFKATVYKSPRSKGFVGYGDADSSNVSPLVRGAEMRVAETRAVNRALRKAYGIGLCSVEELGWLSGSLDPGREPQKSPSPTGTNGASNGQPRLRDRLCLLIRQHQLDSALVKRYAAEFCGTAMLRDASRELVDSFITHLAEWATRDRAGLLSKLNSFVPSQEVNS